MHLDADEPMGPLEPLAPPVPLPPTLSGRLRRFPRHFKDYLPSLSFQVPHMPAPVPRAVPVQPVRLPEPENPVETPQELPEPISIDTEPNEFGLYRSYPSMPSHDPDEDTSLDSVCDSPGLAVVDRASGNWWSGLGCSFTKSIGNFFVPFANASVFRLMEWFYNGSSVKSIADLDTLVSGVILAEDFDPKHLEGFSATRELKRLDDYSGGPGLAENDGWREGSVYLRLPAECVKHTSEADAPAFEVKGVFYRRLIEVVKGTFQDPIMKSFHLTPFRLFWKPFPDALPQRAVSEMYNSDAVLEEHKKIQAQPREPGCTFQLHSRSSTSISSPCLCQIFCTSSNLVCGKRYSHISFASCMQREATVFRC
jgi:hypothetical protein